MDKTVYVLGSINVDLVMKASRFPQRGETMMGSGFFTAHGGKGANQAVACSRLGVKTKLIGAVGEDLFGKESLSSLKKEGIDVGDVFVRESDSTGVATILLVQGDNSILLSPGANASLTEEEIDAGLASAKEGDLFVTELENKPEDAFYGLKRAKEKGMVTFFNPSPMRPLPDEAFSNSDFLIVNEGEAEQCSGILPQNEEDCLSCFGILQKKGLKNLIVTLGGKGSVYAGENGHFAISPHPVSVVDTTGAGDTYLGAFAAMMAKGKGIREAMEFASLASSLACMKAGAQPSVPTLEEVLSHEIR